MKGPLGSIKVLKDSKEVPGQNLEVEKEFRDKLTC